MLTLKRASKSRPSGEWSLDDYDVVERGQYGERFVGRILRSPQAPQGQPWFWTITARVPQDSQDRGYAATRFVPKTRQSSLDNWGARAT